MTSRAKRDTGSQRRVVLTVADQIVSSACNFVTGVAVAQLSGAAQFGEYMLVFMIWLVVVGLHRRAISEPMVVISRNADTQQTLLASGLAAEVLFGSVASLVIATAGLVIFAAGAHLGATMIALAPWFVPLLIQDYWRAMAFQRRRPALALANDVVFAVVQVSAILLFAAIGWRTTGYMFAAWGTGATAGALLGFTWFPAVGGWRDALELLRRLWPLSRWLGADFVTAFGSQQAYVAFAAVVLGNVEYGGFRAAATLVGPTTVILLAAGNIGLPEASRRADADDVTPLRLFARRLTATTVCCVGAYGLALAFAARPLLRVLYGEEFTRFAPLAVLAAVQYVVMVTAYGQGIALKVTGAMRKLWPIRIGLTVVSLISLFMLVHWLGYIGAGWAGVATGAYDALAIYLIYRRDVIGYAQTRRGDAVPVIPAVDAPVSNPLVPPDGVSS